MSSAGASPRSKVFRKMVVTLGVSADELIFNTDGRGPDEDLRLQFEALSRFDPEERGVAKALLDALILKHDARRRSAS